MKAVKTILFCIINPHLIVMLIFAAMLIGARKSTRRVTFRRLTINSGRSHTPHGSERSLMTRWSDGTILVVLDSIELYVLVGYGCRSE